MARDFRRRPFNAADFEHALAYRRLGHTNQEIADALGCSAVTLYRAIRDLDEWREEWTEATASWWRKQHRDRVQDPTAAGSAQLLAKGLDMYVPEAKESRRLEVTGEGGGPVQVESKVVSLADILDFCDRRGISVAELRRLARPSGALPAAPELQPEHP